MMRALLGSIFVLVAAAGSCGTESPPPAGGCREGRTSCGEECVDLDSDPAHCGGCDDACPDEAPFCVDGSCHDDCGALARCEGVCVSLRSDPEHCGSCDRACDAEAPLCGGGECFARCPEGLEQCEGGECADTEVDPRHCGGCGVACRADERCQAGTCVSDEPCVAEGLTLCEGRCVDTQSDVENCGDCGAECVDGDSCVEGACNCPGGECECEEGETDCDPAPDRRACRDLQSDESACGECARACAVDEECVEGACNGQCGGESAFCEGECVDLESDPEHCGGCEVVCDPEQDCVEGTCAEVTPTDCESCPCDDCPAREDPPQRCCEEDGEVVCVVADECPEH